MLFRLALLKQVRPFLAHAGLGLLKDVIQWRRPTVEGDGRRLRGRRVDVAFEVRRYGFGDRRRALACGAVADRVRGIAGRRRIDGRRRRKDFLAAIFRRCTVR